MIFPLLTVLTSLTSILAVEIDVNSKESICNAASEVAKGLMNYYDGYNYGGTVGMMVSPYYWWAAGHAFGGLIGHWYYCDDKTYEKEIWESLMHQTGDNYNYIPANQSTTEGNDDQGFWGFAVLEAAERNFTAPTGDTPDWLALSQAVYNTMLERWDDEHCGGGLRWQIFTWNSGYDYKNTISNACLFHIAGRLARFTGNETYVDTAERVYDWLIDSGFLVLSSDRTHVYDGAQIDDNCSNIVQIEWSYNFGVMIAGCAYLYDFTKSEVWLERTTQLVEGAIAAFFRDQIMYERACQDVDTCNNDQRSFKAIFSRALGITTLLVPELYDTIRPNLEASAKAAAQSCSGGSDGITCGLNWAVDGWDNVWGMGEQMGSLEVILSLLVPQEPYPFSHEDEGVAVGDTEAGIGSDILSLEHNPLKITTKDKAGVAILTAVILLFITGGSIWMIL